MAQFVKLLNEANYNIGKKHTIKFTYFLFLWPNQWLTCSLQCVLSFSSHHMSYDVDILGFKGDFISDFNAQSGTKALLQVFQRVFSVFRVLATREKKDHFRSKQLINVHFYAEQEQR